VEHDDVPLDWAFDAPAYWDGPRGENDNLVPDLCIWTDDGGTETFFIRGVLNLPLGVLIRALGERPCFELHESDHPLVAAQRKGVTMDFVQEMAERHLHAV
jgi:hypothetical protein